MKVENQSNVFIRSCIALFLISMLFIWPIGGWFGNLVVMLCAFVFLIRVITTQALVPAAHRNALTITQNFIALLYSMTFMSFPYFILFNLGILFSIYLGWTLRSNDTRYGDL